VNLAFVPDVLVIPLHSKVLFPNSDAISHQVYSFSSARQFQLPLYRGKTYPPVVFDQPGVVTLGCNIHDNMLAYIVVTSAPYFGRTGADGEWIVPNLPPGKYSLHLWHPLLNEPQEVERTVTTAADRDVIELRLSRDLRPAPLKGRPHSWDYWPVSRTVAGHDLAGAPACAAVGNWHSTCAQSAPTGANLFSTMARANCASTKTTRAFNSAGCVQP
jgi:hypothetical protein